MPAAGTAKSAATRAPGGRGRAGGPRPGPPGGESRRGSPPTPPPPPPAPGPPGGGGDTPGGIADDQRIRLTGRGHAGERGGPPGDLYVVVRVTPDERFVRDGNDLVSVIDLPAPQAALGAKVTVPTLDGEEELDIEPGTQPGTVITLRGKGMPSLRRGRRGDQRVVVNVMIPRKLNAEQRELLERFSATLGGDNLREDGDESLFARVGRALS